MTPQSIRLTVPLDDNLDKIADAWQDAQIDAWNTQFKPQPSREKNASVRTSMTLNAEGSYADAEEADSDGIPGPSPAMADAGDGLTVLEEYRGYILDGGPGLDAPDHRRLSAARKELMVECSVEEGLTSVAKNGQDTNQGVLAGFTVASALKDVSSFYRNAEKGGCIDLYWAEDKIVQPGAVIDYGPPFPAPFPSRGAREWSGSVGYSEAIKNVMVSGDGIPVHDDVLLLINRARHLDVYESMEGYTGFLVENRNPHLEGFVKLVLPTRYGTVCGGLGQNDDAIDPSVPRHLRCPPGSTHRTAGALVPVAAVADEGISPLYAPAPVGRHFSNAEFARLIRWTIGHETGHLLVGPWHLIDPNKLTLMMDNCPVRPDGRVIGLEDVRWDPAEVQRVDFHARQSASMEQ